MYYDVREVPMSIRISVRLPVATAKALDAVASATDRPKSYVIRRALDAYLAAYADYQIALDRLRDKDDPVISASALRSSLARKC